MTDTLDLAAIEARAEAATKGPWESRDYPNDEVWDSKGIWLADVRNEETAAFIAHARSDIPALLARVRELEALVQHMEHTTYCAYCGFEVTIDSPDSSIVVAEHIRTCDKHPLGERVRWLEKELLDLDSRSTGYRVRAERGEARVRELEVKVLALQLVRDQLKNAEPIERAAAVRAERERCLGAIETAWQSLLCDRVPMDMGIRELLDDICRAIREGE